VRFDKSRRIGSRLQNATPSVIGVQSADRTTAFSAARVDVARNRQPTTLEFFSSQICYRALCCHVRLWCISQCPLWVKSRHR